MSHSFGIVGFSFNQREEEKVKYNCGLRERVSHSFGIVGFSFHQRE